MSKPKLVLANGEPCFHHQAPPPYVVRDHDTEKLYAWRQSQWCEIDMKNTKELDEALELLGRGNAEIGIGVGKR